MPQIGSSSYSESPVPSESYVSGETTITLQDHEAAADAHAGIIATHDADTSTHGVTTVAGLEETQTLSNKTLASPVITGTLSGSAITLTGNLTVGGTLGATNGTFSGTLAVTGDLSVNTNKFTVAAASGNTVVAGTLGVTGAGTFSSTLASTGNFSVNTNKFTVAASTGNTAIAGTLGVTGASTLAALGATTGSFSSTLASTGNFTVNTNKFVVTAASGNTAVAGTLGVTGAGTFSAGLTVSSTANPVTRTTRVVANTTDAWTSLQVEAQSTGNMGDAFGPQLQFTVTDTGVSNSALASILAARAGADNTGALQLRTYSAGTPNDGLYIDSSGQVGVNDSTPSYRLDVNGTGRFTGAVTLDSTLAVADRVTGAKGFKSWSGTIANNGVQSIAAGMNSCFALVMSQSSGQGVSILSYHDNSYVAPYATAAISDSKTAVTVATSTSALTGTTGGAATITVSLNSGTFYLENRSGSSTVFFITLFGA